MSLSTLCLYSRVFLIYLPDIIKIDPYNFELYRFKVGSFLRHSVYSYNMHCFSVCILSSECYSVYTFIATTTSPHALSVYVTH